MPEISPGSHKYRHSNAIPYELGSDVAQRGDSLAVGAAGSAVTTTGSNGFLGVLQSATAADAAADDSVTSDIASGDEVSVAVQGVVRAKVSAFDSGTGGTVSAGDLVEAGADGALVTVDSDASGAADAAGVGDPMAVADEDADGFALVRLP